MEENEFCLMYNFLQKGDEVIDYDLLFLSLTQAKTFHR